MCIHHHLSEYLIFSIIIIAIRQALAKNDDNNYYMARYAACMQKIKSTVKVRIKIKTFCACKCAHAELY